MLGMSRQQFGTYAKRPDAPRKTKSGYNVEQWRKYVKETKKNGLTGDGSLRDEKLLREIDKLDIQIEEMRGELVNRKEEEARFMARWMKARKAVEDWRAHETAKHPEQADIINQLADRLCEMVHD